MSRRPRLFARGVLYHVIVRGNQRQKTFLNDADFHAYVERLERYRKKAAVTVHAYCLMPNHVHLLVEMGAEPLSRFMQGVQQSYTQCFKRTHKKVGHLFQGRYKAIVCEKDAYLLELIRYIHQNPVRAKLARRIEEYPYTSDRTYRSGLASEVVEPRAVLSILGGTKGYRKFVQEAEKEGHREEYYQVEDQRFLGAMGFGEKLKEKHGEDQNKVPKKSLSVVYRNIARGMEIEPEVLGGSDRGWQVSRARAVAGYVLIRRLGYRLKDVAKCLGRDMATVSSLISRYTEQMDDRKLRRQVEALVKISKN